MFLILVQLLVPILLIGLLALPGSPALLKAVQSVTAGLYILAAQMVGLWLDMPYWSAWLLWGLFAGALLYGWRYRTRQPISRLRHKIAFGGWIALGLFAAWLLAGAAMGRRPPAGAAVELSMPLPEGSYMVANGGSAKIVNAHLKTLHPRTTRQALYRGQSYGVDIVALTPGGRQSSEWRPRSPAAYAIFGATVYAPCAGRVVQSRNDRPDMPVPIPDEQVMEGDHVLLQCGRAQVLLAHFRRGSVIVTAGSLVGKGQKLGEVGNSGNSDVPHLHIHAQQPGPIGARLSSQPLPIRLDGKFLVRGDRL